MKTTNSCEKYIARFPDEVQEILNNIRTLIKQHAQQADESMAYGMPAYKLNGKPLVYFAAYKQHIGLYATPSGHEKFATKLAKYKQGKGSVQFPLSEKMPYRLISEIIKFRVKENGNPAKEKKMKKPTDTKPKLKTTTV